MKNRVIFYLVKCILYLIGKTLRFEKLEISAPGVIAVFHDEMFPVLFHLRSLKPIFLASRHRDGKMLGCLLEEWGYEVVYGSSGKNKGGKEALAEILTKMGKDRIVIITPDGPRGPRHKMKAGAIVLAKKGLVPLYLVRALYKGKRLHSWDKFLFPLPFSKVIFKHTIMPLGHDSSYEDMDNTIKDAEMLLKNLSCKQIV